MSPKIKLSLAIVNIFCLILTIITPSSTTFLSIFPALIAAMSWLFVSEKHPQISEQFQFLVIVAYMLAIITCAFLAMTADIVPASSEDSAQTVDTSTTAIDSGEGASVPQDSGEDASVPQEEHPDSNKNTDGQYLLKFRSGILLLSNRTCPYVVFALIYGVSVILLMLIEVVCDLTYHFSAARGSSASMHKIINNATKYIK